MIRPPGAPEAYAALTRGTAFLQASAGRLSASASPVVAGNAFAELDRLLHVLIAHAARDRRVRLSTRSRGNADTLAALCGAHGDGDRLRALVRSTICLRRHNGRARHADRRACGFMTVGWSDPGSIGPRRIAIGASIVPTAEQIADVCAFYDRLARRIMEGRRHTGPTFPPHGLARLAA